MPVAAQDKQYPIAAGRPAAAAARRKNVRRGNFMPKSLFLFDAGGLDDLGPLLGFRSDEMAEISG